MEQSKCSADSRKGKHLKRTDRIVIEQMSRGGYPPRDIAATLGRDQRTIERELLRGQVVHKDTEWREKNVYSSDRGQCIHDFNATAKGPGLKLGKDYELVEFVRNRITEHKDSPDVVAYRMREAGMERAVCTKTLYNYIDQGLIAGVSNESLWEKRKRKKQQQRCLRRSAKRISKGASIEQRPSSVGDRDEFGHWEMDLVVGPTAKSNTALLTLVERKHRILITLRLPNKTQISVLEAINRIERQYGARRFREIFKSITVDNGSEFLDFKALEISTFSKQQRTQIFYAHPYSSWERGSNENANKLIRRFIAKGRDISRFTKRTIKDVETWITDYPRRILDFKTPNELFMNELKAIS